jgi:AMP deaminase
MLSMKFDMHRLLNREREASEQKAVPHRDFFNVRKCDTHVHHSACMSQKHLLRFIKSKLKKESDTVVLTRDGKTLTLAGVFQSLNLTAYDLSLDVLDMHADWTTKHRFDRFNLKYSPLGQSRLREVFLKTNNLIKGRFLAEITKEVLADLEATKYSLAEYRLSIYGLGRDEWRKLAAWVVTNKLSSPNVRWMVQIPRLYDTMRASSTVTTFADMMGNVFAPLFVVTLNPASDPILHQFLSQVSGFDSVDDESKTEPHMGSFADLPPPNEWSYPEQPPYAYQTYYMAAK